MARARSRWQTRKRRLLQWQLWVPVTRACTRTALRAWCCLYKTACSGQATGTPSFGRCIGWERCGLAGSMRGGRALPLYKMKAGELPVAVVSARKMFSLSSSSTFFVSSFVFALCGVSQSFERTRNTGEGWWGLGYWNCRLLQERICFLWLPFISVEITFSCDFSLHIWRQKYIIWVTYLRHFEIMQRYVFDYFCWAEQVQFCLQFCS